MKNDVPIYLDAICLRKLDFSLFSVTIVQSFAKTKSSLKIPFSSAWCVDSFTQHSIAAILNFEFLFPQVVKERGSKSGTLLIKTGL